MTTNPRTTPQLPKKSVLQFVDDDTYIFITTPEGNTADVEKMMYHTDNNTLEILCGKSKKKRGER